MVVSAVPGRENAGGDLAIDKPIDEPRFLENIRLLLDRDGHPPTRTVHFLMLHEANQPPESAPSSFTARCEMEYCSLDALPVRLHAGFRGMVVVPSSLLSKVDLSLLQSTPNLEIMIMPQAAEPTGMPASPSPTRLT
jgi:hypothetical protein